MKTSYRTIVFGTVAFVCAAAPALAESVPAVPKNVSQAAVVRTAFESVPAVPKESVPAVPKESVPAVPKESVPAVPKESVPAVPKESVPAVPKESVPAVPKESVPAVPKDVLGPVSGPMQWFGAAGIMAFVSHIFGWL